MEWIFLILAVGGFIWWKSETNRKKRAKAKEKALTEQERQRIEGCGEVVRFAANYLGYEAKQAISRPELEKLIDQGSTPTQLAQEIARRCESIPGIVLGFHQTVDFSLPVRLPYGYRLQHIYVVGKSGYGKSNLLRNMALQDMVFGYGVGIIAPEQELFVEEVLPFIPDNRIEDVIYFNPADTENPVCFNPLILDAGEDLDLKVDETFTIFRRLLGEGGPRMDEILRNALYALIELPGTTLLDFEVLLDRGHSDLRERVIRECKDERTVQFFRDVYAQFPKDAHLPIVNRIGRLIRAKYVRNCLCHPTQSLNFRKAMDEGKILLFNLSDGILGEATSQLLGQLVVSKFQTTTISRADVAKEERNPFYLYVDEFQSFVGTAGVSYEKILSRARKYKLGLVLAHQQTGQIPLELLKEIFGNVSTLISFQLSQADASKIAREFVTEFDGEIVPLEPDRLLGLKVGEAYCKIGPNAFPMKTEFLDIEPDAGRVQDIIEQSRQLYGAGGSTMGRLPARGETPKLPAPKSDPLEGLEPGEIF